jgi:predicted transcriptional regulator
MAGKRTRIDIIGDILHSIASKGGKIKPTHLMYKSNLSYSQLRNYIDDLISKEFIIKANVGSNTHIAITEKGYEFLVKLKEIKEFEKAFGF